MRITFLGTGQFAVPSLEALVDAGHQVAAVVTSPTGRRAEDALSPPRR